MKRHFLILLSLISLNIWATPTELKSCAASIDSLTLRDHMICLSLRMDEAFALIGKKAARKEAVEHLEQMRLHLQRTIALSPSRFATLTPDEQRNERRQYHRMQAEAILLVSQLEELWLASRNDDDQIELSPKANQITTRLQQVIGLSHQRFRKR